MTKINPECPFDKESFDFFVAHNFYNSVCNSEPWQKEGKVSPYLNYLLNNNSLTIDFELLDPRVFEKVISQPLQELFETVVNHLPLDEINHLSNQMVVSNFFKEGRPVSYYEQALIFVGKKESFLNPQFYLCITEQGLDFGFRINKLKDFQKLFPSLEDKTSQLFIYNFRKNFFYLLSAYKESLYYNNFGDLEYFLNPRLKFRVFEHPQMMLDYFFNVSLSNQEVLQLTFQKLSQKIAHRFIGFYPLVLLATQEDPMPAIINFINKPLAELSQNIRVEVEILKKWIRAINRKKQAILQGPPGTGKTYLAKQLGKHLIGGGDGFMELVQFHPAYCYEDFIQGIRPQANEHGQLDYPVVLGRFLEFCKKAESCEDTCVLIIDEINRANLSSVFGELMYLLEYRDEKIPLAGSNELFGIPENVRIIGTMNTADRSIALVDHALRRRFAFIELRPNYEILRRYHEREATDFPVDGLIATLQRVNQVIDDPDYELGISFFMLPDLADQIEDVWRMEIEPYLEEYFFDQRDKLEPFRWEAIAQTILP
ncbi:AAA family ATPase [Laspinema sp. D1]|uniref:AAA family ATPase n=1 Tax=Laspinema palackyanum D2a TaxID=2953684 RepID=A0ABT2MRK9_9CYAN|nr:AAA family ATPase [Laspinema sp. D2a]